MILFGGDPHGDFEPIRMAALAHGPSAVVLLGDMDLERPLHVELADLIEQGIDVHWVPGNHDGDRDSWYANLFGGPSAAGNLHGRVTEIDGVRVAGLGGVFRQEVWYPREGAEPVLHERAEMLGMCATGTKLQRFRASFETRPGLPRRHRVTIWPEDYDRMMSMIADVLVVHEAPTTHRHGWEAIDRLAQAMGVHTIVHGHHHRDYVDTLPCGIKVISSGIAGVRDLDGNLLVAGKRRERKSMDD